MYLGIEKLDDSRDQAIKLLTEANSKLHDKVE